MSITSQGSISTAMGEILVAPTTITVVGTRSNFLNINPLYRLDGTKYLQWSQVVLTFLKGGGKIGHLNDPSPKETGPGFTDLKLECSHDIQMVQELHEND